jgi:HlyD family secretion protein
MKISYLLPGLAACGVAAMLAAILVDAHPAQQLPLPASPPGAYANAVTGSGTVEADGGSIAIGAPVAGIVTAVHVKPGQQVAARAPLFELDNAEQKAQLPVAKAAVAEALVRQDEARKMVRIALNVPDQRAVSEEERVTRQGALAVAGAAVATARARLTQLAMEEQRRIVRSPVAGTILQVNVHSGEAAPGLAAGKALILMAADGPRLLRVDIDEFEAGRVRPGARALASPRGHPATRLPLVFERIEPTIGPKAGLAGTATERVDTRVLQVIYRFAPGAAPDYIGQQMDVVIDAGKEPAR